MAASLQHLSSQNSSFCGPISSWFTTSLGTLRVKDPLNGWTVMWKMLVAWLGNNNSTDWPMGIAIYSIPEKLQLSLWHQADTKVLFKLMHELDCVPLSYQLTFWNAWCLKRISLQHMLQQTVHDDPKSLSGMFTLCSSLWSTLCMLSPYSITIKWTTLTLILLCTIADATPVWTVQINKYMYVWKC